MFKAFQPLVVVNIPTTFGPRGCAGLHMPTPWSCGLSLVGSFGLSIDHASYSVSDFDVVFGIQGGSIYAGGSHGVYMLYMFYVFGLLTSAFLILYYLIPLAVNRNTSFWPFMNFVQIHNVYMLLYSCVVC